MGSLFAPLESAKVVEHSIGSQCRPARIIWWEFDDSGCRGSSGESGAEKQTTR